VQKNYFSSRFAKGFASSLGLVFGLFLFVMIAYAFTTWNPGLAPQASPENGNVTLSSGYVKGGWYGYCVTYSDWVDLGDGQGYNSGGGGCTTSISPEICSVGVCSCPTGFTIKSITDTGYIHYCIKN
jgi:hypothetical protein